MNETSIACTLRPAPGALERLLRVIRFRGFAVDSMSVAPLESGRHAVALRVTGHRAPENLLAQLEKLVDVEQVAPVYEQPAAAEGRVVEAV
jgi:acetolactate synthase II small subunit